MLTKWWCVIISDRQKSLNDIAWEKLFEKYDILGHIERTGQFQISAKQIKEVREPRLMAKFDHTINLPRIFADNELSILPVTRGDYIISHFDAYHEFETDNSLITRVSLPTYIQKTYNSIHNHRLVQIPCVIFLKGLERQFCPIFAPKNDRNKAVSIFPVVFLFSGGKED